MKPQFTQILRLRLLQVIHSSSSGENTVATNTSKKRPNFDMLLLYRKMAAAGAKDDFLYR